MSCVNKMVRAGLVAADGLLVAALNVVPVPAAHAARGPEVGTLQVTWVQKGSWPAPASAHTVEGQVLASLDCSGVYTNDGESFVTSPECLDPRSPRVKDALDNAFGHMLDTWGSREGEHGYYKPGPKSATRQRAFDGRKFSTPAILMDGEGMMVTRVGKLQQSVDGGVRQVFPRPGSQRSLEQARKAGIAVFALNQPNPAQSVDFTNSELAAGDTAMVVWFDDTGVDRNAGEVPEARSTSVRLGTKSPASNGVKYWWYQGKNGPSLTPSAVGAPVFVNGKLAGIVAVNPNDTPEVLYIMDTADLRKVLKKHGALEVAPDEEPTQAPSPSETATAKSSSPEPTVVEPSADPVPAEPSVAPSADEPRWSFQWFFVQNWRWGALGLGILYLGVAGYLVYLWRSTRRSKPRANTSNEEDARDTLQ